MQRKEIVVVESWSGIVAGLTLLGGTTFEEVPATPQEKEEGDFTLLFVKWGGAHQIPLPLNTDDRWYKARILEEGEKLSEGEELLFLVLDTEGYVVDGLRLDEDADLSEHEEHGAKWLAITEGGFTERFVHRDGYQWVKAAAPSFETLFPEESEESQDPEDDQEASDNEER